MPGFYPQYGVNPYGGYQQYQTAQAPANPQPAPMSRQMVHADIVLVNSVEEVQGFPVNAGSVVMFQLGGGEAFITKEVTADGQMNIDIYPKQPKKPAPPPFDPSQFVTREELEKRLGELTARRGRKDEADAGQEG